MTAFAIVFTLVFALVLSVVFLLMPTLVPRTTPLGVSVPAARTAEPVIATSVRWYRRAVVVAGLVTVCAGIVLSLTVPAVAVVVVPLLSLALCGIVYVVARHPILRAKRDGDWYAGVETRLTADVTPQPRRRPPYLWLLISVVLLVIGFGTGVALYPGLPARIPTHWGGAGQVDAWSDKSVWAAFGPLFIAVLVALGFYGISWLVMMSNGRAVASDTPAQARARTDAVRGVTTSVLGQLSVLIAAAFSVLSVLMWVRADAAIGVASTVLVVVLVLVVIFALVRYARAMARVRAGADATVAETTPERTLDPAVGRDAPDDDRFWKAGLVYVNRDDPATFVPKRFGVGWTVNLGSPGGMAFGIALLLVLVVSIGFGIIGSLPA